MILHVNALRLLRKLNSYYLLCFTLSSTFNHIPENVWNYLLRLATNAEKRTAFIISKLFYLVVLCQTPVPFKRDSVSQTAQFKLSCLT